MGTANIYFSLATIICLRPDVDYHRASSLFLHLVGFNGKRKRSKLLTLSRTQESVRSVECSSLVMFDFPGENEGSSAGTPTQLNPIQRKKKPKRRSTGVVNLEIEVSMAGENFT